MTDSGREVRHDRAEKPGVANLIEIMSVATGDSIDAIESQFYEWNPSVTLMRTDVDENRRMGRIFAEKGPIRRWAAA